MTGTVLLISRDRVTRAGLTEALRMADANDRIVDACSITDAIQQFARERPRLIIVETGPGLAESIGQLRQVWPEAPVLVIARAVDPAALLQSLKAGARGFAVYGGDDLTRFLETCRQLRRGEWAVCNATLEQLITAFLREQPNPCTVALTPRERDVMDHMIAGLSNDEIARALSVSGGTVKRHISDILAKLEARTRAEAISRVLGGSNARANGLPPTG